MFLLPCVCLCSASLPNDSVGRSATCVHCWSTMCVIVAFIIQRETTVHWMLLSGSLGLMIFATYSQADKQEDESCLRWQMTTTKIEWNCHLSTKWRYANQSIIHFTKITCDLLFKRMTMKHMSSRQTPKRWGVNKAQKKQNTVYTTNECIHIHTRTGIYIHTCIYTPTYTYPCTWMLKCKQLLVFYHLWHD